MSDIVGSLIHSRLLETFRRYLFTAHRIADADAELREAFWSALGREVVSRQVVEIDRRRS